jgi:hypothetical protein
LLSLYSVDDRQISMEHWWNDTDKGKQKYLKWNLPQCHLGTTNPIRLAWNWSRASVVRNWWLPEPWHGLYVLLGATNSILHSSDTVNMQQNTRKNYVGFQNTNLYPLPQFWYILLYTMQHKEITINILWNILWNFWIIRPSFSKNLPILHVLCLK